MKTQGVWRTRKYRDQQRLLTHGSGACIAQRLLLEVVLERDMEDPYAVQKHKGFLQSKQERLVQCVFVQSSTLCWQVELFQHVA